MKTRASLRLDRALAWMWPAALAWTLLALGCATGGGAVTVDFTFRNESVHSLDWLRLDGAKANPIGGITSPGIEKLSLSIPWYYEDSVVVTFVDNYTRQRYRITADCRAVNAALKKGACRGIILAILDYDKVEVRCEERPSTAPRVFP